MNVLRGEIWYADLESNNSRVQGGKRPVIIVSNDQCNKYSPVITVVALTSNLSKMKLPTHVLISERFGLRSDSVALCEQPRSIDKSTLLSKVGDVDTKIMISIEKAIMTQLGIHSQKETIIKNEVKKEIIKIDYDYVKRVLLSIEQLNKLSKQIGQEIQAKKILIEELMNYAKQFGREIKDIILETKLMQNKKVNTQGIQHMQMI
jgi:mRNA interferase MazF